MKKWNFQISAPALPTSEAWCDTISKDLWMFDFIKYLFPLPNLNFSLGWLVGCHLGKCQSFICSLLEGSCSFFFVLFFFFFFFFFFKSKPTDIGVEEAQYLRPMCHIQAFEYAVSSLFYIFIKLLPVCSVLQVSAHQWLPQRGLS